MYLWFTFWLNLIQDGDYNWSNFVYSKISSKLLFNLFTDIELELDVIIVDRTIYCILQILTAHARLGKMLQYSLRFLIILFSRFDQSGYTTVIQHKMNLD